MLAKKFRLPIGKWNRERNKKTSTGKGDFFIVKTAANNLEFSRFGIIIGSKNFKTAVRRNELKRLVFDFIRSNGLYGKPGRDNLIIVQPRAAKAEKPEIEKELKKLLS